MIIQNTLYEAHQYLNQYEQIRFSELNKTCQLIVNKYFDTSPVNMYNILQNTKYKNSVVLFFKNKTNNKKLKDVLSLYKFTFTKKDLYNAIKNNDYVFLDQYYKLDKRNNLEIMLYACKNNNMDVLQKYFDNSYNANDYSKIFRCLRDNNFQQYNILKYLVENISSNVLSHVEALSNSKGDSMNWYCEQISGDDKVVKLLFDNKFQPIINSSGIASYVPYFYNAIKNNDLDFVRQIINKIDSKYYFYEEILSVILENLDATKIIVEAWLDKKKEFLFNHLEDYLFSMTRQDGTIDIKCLEYLAEVYYRTSKTSFFQLIYYGSVDDEMYDLYKRNNKNLMNLIQSYHKDIIYDELENKLIEEIKTTLK
jgi:hypothetical protein